MFVLGRHGLFGSIALLASVLCLRAQDDGVETFQAIQIERAVAPANRLTLQPPTSAVTPYVLLWPFNGPVQGHRLVVNSTVAPWQLDWTTSTNGVVELVSSGDRNLRRSAAGLQPPSPLGSGPGTDANDFQGARTSSSQSASGSRSTILGGANNEASNTQAAVGGGLSNRVSNVNSVVVGGNSNAVTNTTGAILGGANNATSNPGTAIFGGQNNSLTNDFTFIGGGRNNSVSNPHGAIGGGWLNQITNGPAVIIGGADNRSPASNTVIGGGMNNRVQQGHASVGGGGGNSANASSHVTLGGGRLNSVTSTHGTVFGGLQNSVTAQRGVVVGGESNTSGNGHTTVGGGQSNTASAWSYATVIGGQSNSATDAHASILGGLSNSVTGSHSVVLGGRSTTLSAIQIAAFNAGPAAITISSANSFTAANTDVWLANTDGTPRALRLYEQHNGATIPGAATTNYVALQASTANHENVDNTYTLPDRVGSVGQVLTVSSTPAPTQTAATLTWAAAPSNYVVGAQDINANNTAVTAGNMNGVHLLRLTANGIPNARRVTLQNGTTGGLLLAVRARSNDPGGNPGRGVRLLAADANLALQNDADVDLDHNDTIMLVWDAVDAVWIEVGRTIQ